MPYPSLALIDHPCQTLPHCEIDFGDYTLSARFQEHLLSRMISNYKQPCGEKMSGLCIAMCRKEIWRARTLDEGEFQSVNDLVDWASAGQADSGVSSALAAGFDVKMKCGLVLALRRMQVLLAEGDDDDMRISQI